MSTVPALWTRHRGLARHLAAGYFLPGAERQGNEALNHVTLDGAATSPVPHQGDEPCSPPPA